MLDRKRNNKMDTIMHRISRYIVRYCEEHDIDVIVIGKNKNWKQNSDMGKINNQTFVQIPFAKLIEKIKYKAEEKGIIVITREESYTSKCDALALEPIKNHKKYLGKRKERGLFQSSTGRLINADVNGALNILRKEIGDEFIKEIIKNKFDLTPYKITIV
jgi:putative transposase